MKIFLDTNFIIDYLIREEYKASCEQLLSIGIRNKFDFVNCDILDIMFKRETPSEIL